MYCIIAGSPGGGWSDLENELRCLSGIGRQGTLLSFISMAGSIPYCYHYAQKSERNY